jgi:hypothetical protein
MSIKDIITGWKNDWLDKRGKIPAPIKELFDARLSACKQNECGKLMAGICTACGCPVRKKTKVLTEECPENMWNPVVYANPDESKPAFIVLEEVPESLREPLKSFLIEKWTNEGTSKDTVGLGTMLLNNPYAWVWAEDWNAFLESLSSTS